MRYVSATEAKQALSAVLDAAQREPVMIQHNKRDVAVIAGESGQRPAQRRYSTR